MTSRTFAKPALYAASVPLALGALLFGASTASAAVVTSQFDLQAATEGFQDSGVVATATGTATVSATGTAFFAAEPQATTTPAGGYGLCGDTCPLPNEQIGALVVKVGDGAPTLAGTGPTVVTGVGAIRFAYNDVAGADNYADNAGSYAVTITYDDGITPEPEQPNCLDLGFVCIPLSAFGS
ncbi:MULTISPECIES: LecA/PA-IL family lectin [unclassified Rhodococcus (in: high G+C Gram-positive bacteria)]|uniref:LecA/PA-IL family lectin n=1 Tax=unclassified Rhodococcus (in: high G+C Gram-positive bacteria) TaxID=192944 RepID=UPI00138F682E|nr:MULTISPECIES: LecA/PA-IL family lectin [unclassified Rhodococcus (in: high G+C Gram-positive bacteria)]